jgi:hypothetical protein
MMGPSPRNGKKALVVLNMETGGFEIIPTAEGSEEPTEADHAATTGSASSSKDSVQEPVKDDLEDAIERETITSIDVFEAYHTATKDPVPSDSSAESDTDVVLKSQIAALIEAHSKLIEGVPVETPDVIEDIIAIIEEMKTHLLKLKAVAKVEAPKVDEVEESKGHTDTVKTGIGASFQDVAATLGEIEAMIVSDAAPVVVNPYRGQIFNPAAKEFVPSQSKAESSNNISQTAKAPLTAEEKPSKIQREATTAIAPTEPQDAAVTLTTTQVEGMKAEATDNNNTAPQEVAVTVPTTQTKEAKVEVNNNNTEPEEVAVTVPTTQTEQPKAEAAHNNVAAEVPTAKAITAQATATQTRLTVNRNPHFAAEVKGMTYDKEEAQTKLVEDIDRSERDGNLETLCIVCDKPSSNLCDRCKHAKYCSRECQVADWSLHKKVCADFAGPAADGKRPSPEHRRILFFPTFSTKPELLWAIHHETDDNEWLEFDHADVALFCEKAKVESQPGKRKGHSVLNLMNTLGERSVISKHEGIQNDTDIKCRRIGHMLTAITWTVANSTDNPLQPKLVNKSINALSKPGYLRYVLGIFSSFFGRF